MQKNLNIIYPEQCYVKTPVPIQFFKEKYVINNSNKDHINVNRTEVYKLFELSMKAKNNDKITNHTNFYNILSEYGITTRKTGGFFIFDISYDDLVNIIKKHKFFNEDELLLIEEREKAKDDGYNEETKKQIIRNEIEQLEKKLAMLKTQLANM